MWVEYVYVCVLCVCLVLEEAGRGHWIRETGATGSRELPGVDPVFSARTNYKAMGMHS